MRVRLDQFYYRCFAAWSILWLAAGLACSGAVQRGTQPSLVRSSGAEAAASPPASVPAPADRDQDGIPDARDACPDQPEDKNRFEDDDGCPEPDQDGDGIVDACDHCPSEPEDYGCGGDLDGCPEGNVQPPRISGIVDVVRCGRDRGTVPPSCLEHVQAIAAARTPKHIP